jgi:alkylation response protein AidB-like acyl-CoA dehydrogenase
MLADSDAPDGGRLQRMVLTIPSASIAGGSDEIQRNIIGERVLGLPKDIVVDRDIPFREVRR